MEHTALLIIDIINDFQFKHGETLAEKTLAISPQIVALKHYMYDKGLPVIYINDHYKLWQADYGKIIEKCRNALSGKIIDELQPRDKDYFLIKPKHSAFYGTALHTLLSQLKIKKLILTGIAGNICVLFTANDAYMREFELVIPKDGVASADDQDNHYALRMMENVLKAEVKETWKLLTST
ncbi:isochorismatase family cysteine hydrolase [Sutcliffiella rhizosphaerae]|uniref:Peroxyureidoacrylate/ureidoacrylate amidohydrolase RutB n=1 Tax=Sutcliffiella rhizosphaerae TaxID=2880967 RepID=A0ABN8AE36_9BACI|nr:isochorismatase family cysteine hydrolase [Sutcliffiella rhizosphaerae]CAG9623548.1 Peroxyureidoacrylate/ureidoacrylate amidohydrolase RutB [Sutcliffiella rhizosphaerae]